MAKPHLKLQHLEQAALTNAAILEGIASKVWEQPEDSPLAQVWKKLGLLYSHRLLTPIGKRVVQLEHYWNYLDSASDAILCGTKPNLSMLRLGLQNYQAHYQHVAATAIEMANYPSHVCDLGGGTGIWGAMLQHEGFKRG
ncbi:MAG: hypothetical protein R3330_07335, partial [Saprospiraceae bacterium]|nr:hypothetical protein [Saprospiraceae bacterium]